jgi:hypothetical protein
VTFLYNGIDHGYHLKKSEIEELRYNKLPVDSVLLYEDEKEGPVTAKTYGGTSWLSSIIPSKEGIQGSKDKRHSKHI